MTRFDYARGAGGRIDVWSRPTGRAKDEPDGIHGIAADGTVFIGCTMWPGMPGYEKLDAALRVLIAMNEEMNGLDLVLEAWVREYVK